LENPCKIVCFGDSITKAWAPLLEVALRNKFPDHQIDIVNLGVVSDTTAGAVRRLHSVLAERPDVVLIGFGMNDWRKDIDREKFRSNLSFLAEKLVAQSIRTVFLTINPGGRVFGEIAPEIVEYNENVMAIAKQCCCRVVDVFSAFTEKVFPVSKGLYDEIHPNELGDRVITEELLDIVPLDQTVIVWTFNGEHCFCNYECPYCYVPSEVNMGHAYPGAPEKWHEALKRSFGNQKLVFYFSFGEPMGGKGFYELIEMIGEEQRWGCHITTNLSLPLGRLLKTKLVRENRLHVNASFHPTQTSIVSFLERLLILRQHGIEPSIVYVMYPPQLAEFADYFEVFRQHGLFVHVRRFRGIYDGRPYPQSYTEEERRFVARYCDTLTVKYMLNDMEDKPEETASKLSYAGMNYFMLDHHGYVWRSPDFKGERPLGNILRDDFAPVPRLTPFGGTVLGSVNIIAALRETGMHQLEGNHTWSFAQQGGCFRNGDGSVHYPLERADFQDEHLLKILDWPATDS